MIGVEELWADLLCDPEIIKTRFSDYFLTQVVAILSNRGFHETKIFLWDSCSNPCLSRQAKTLLYALKRIEELDGISDDTEKARLIIHRISQIRCNKNGL